MALFRSLSDLSTVRDDWDALATGLQSPVLEFDWIACSLQAFHDPADVHVLTLTANGSTTALAPLVLDRTHAHRFVLPGAAALYEPGGWLYDTTDALQALTGDVIALGRPVVLHRVHHAEDLRRALSAPVAQGAFVRLQDVAPSYSLAMATSWEDYAATLPGRTFKKAASLRRRAERELGAASVTVHDLAPEDVEAHLNLLIGLEATGWKGRQGSALANRSDLRTFFTDYTRRAAERRRARVSVLRFGTTPAAIELAVVAFDRHWVLKIAYHDALAAYGPGILLTDESVRACFQQGLRSYEFMGVAEHWQARWHPARRSHAALALYPLTARGAGGAIRDVWAAAARRWRRVRTVSSVATTGEAS